MLDVTLEDVFLDCLAISPRVPREVYIEPRWFFIRLRRVIRVSNLPGLVPRRRLIIGRFIELFLSRHYEDSQRVRWSEEFRGRLGGLISVGLLSYRDGGCGMAGSFGWLEFFYVSGAEKARSNLSPGEIPGTCTVPEPNTWSYHHGVLIMTPTGSAEVLHTYHSTPLG